MYFIGLKKTDSQCVVITVLDPFLQAIIIKFKFIELRQIFQLAHRQVDNFIALHIQNGNISQITGNTLQILKRAIRLAKSATIAEIASMICVQTTNINFQ